MSGWAPSSRTWAESGTPFLGSRVTCLQGFQTEHESSSGTKARHADVGTDSSAASSATALTVRSRWQSHCLQRHKGTPPAAPLPRSSLVEQPSQPPLLPQTPWGAPARTNVISLQLLSEPRAPTSTCRSIRQPGRGTAGPSFWPVCLSRCKEGPLGQGLGSWSCQQWGGPGESPAPAACIAVWRTPQPCGVTRFASGCCASLCSTGTGSAASCFIPRHPSCLHTLTKEGCFLLSVSLK